ncbi:MAG TPA: hypothetical protein VN025_15920 [Candidatus Dormibacteraeota bacterium]|nr:hypothetical protein [Candidatus Dormibacteraeota bacterium]
MNPEFGGPVTVPFSVLRSLFSLVLAGAFLLPPNGPQISPVNSAGIQRDAQAIVVIQKAITGLAAQLDPAQISSVVVTGTVSLPANDPPIEGTITLEDSLSISSNEFRDTFQSANINQSFVSGHGSPGLISNGTVISFGSHYASCRQFLHIPWLGLTKLLANPNANISFVKQTLVNNQPAVQIHFHDDSDLVQQVMSVQDWYFDQTSGLPVRVEYRVPSTPTGLQFIQVTSDFSSFQTVQGIAIPFHIVSSADGRVERDMTITSVKINQPLSSTDFDLPAAVTK